MAEEQAYIVVLGSDRLGDGNDELGRILMKSFVSNLIGQDQLPDEILLYNQGVQLLEEGSDLIEDFQTLVEKGSQLKACGTCLNFFELEDKIAVGEVTTMAHIIQSMRTYDRVVRP